MGVGSATGTLRSVSDLPHLSVAYRSEREGLSTLVLGLDADTLARPLPACPEWTPREVLAHVAGVVSDILAGNLSDVGSDEWTAAQIAARDGLTVDAIVAEWAEQAATVESLLDDAPPEMAMALLSDLCTHHIDVRAGVGDPSGRDSDSVQVVFAAAVTQLGARLDAAGAPGLVVHTVEGEQLQTGSGAPGARIRGSRFDLLRAMTGRRSADQIRSFIWDGSCEAYIAPFSRYPMRSDALDESTDA